MKKICGFGIILILLIFISSCSIKTSTAAVVLKKPLETEGGGDVMLENEYCGIKDAAVPVQTDDELLSLAESKYKNKVPLQWGEKVSGVKTMINTEKKVIALTFDACGGKNGDRYDKKLIDYLISEKVPATLFINSRWIDANYDIFIELSKNPLFEIENHGYVHLPLSINGKSAYNIKGTGSIKEVIDEVKLNEHKIERITERKPRYFRSGTAYYDEIAVSIVEEVGEKVVNFNIIGDAGATYSKEQIKKACLSAVPGSIIIFHMNHPEKDTAEGIMMVVPELRKKGFEFVKLDDYNCALK